MSVDPCGCVDEGGPPTPLAIDNRPALSAVSYRIGSYARFRRTMLAGLNAVAQLAGWRVRNNDDYGIAVVDMWAYLLEILAFYQERIANEAYLRTATTRESVARLAATLDYKPSPGMSAQTYLAFTAEAGKQVTVPIGLRVQSVPGQGELPQKFEALETVTAYGSLNVVGLKLTQSQQLHSPSYSLLLAGTGTRLVVGDHLLMLGEHQGDRLWDVRQLTSVEADTKIQATKVGWANATQVAYQNLPAGELSVYAFRQRAAMFGHNAPDWNTIPDAWKNPNPDTPKPNGHYPDWTNASIPEDTVNRNDVFLDKVYQQLLPKSWAVLITEESGKHLKALYLVNKVAQTGCLNYTLSANVTRITVDPTPPGNTFGIRKTIALVQSEKLSLAKVPIPTVGGYTLALDGVYPDLAKGRRLLAKGTLAGGDESVDVLQVDAVDSQAGYTTVNLHASLAEYEAAGLRIYGNVALGGHGETVAGEPLGSGDASAAFQTFTLGKSPVSFVPRAGAAHGAANTLDLRVDRVQWSEVATFYGTGGNDAVYTTEEDELGRMTVRFGDGRTGARLPTGRNNIAGSYRRGIGMVGNVRAGSLTTLLDRPVGLSAAINPDPAGGGADAEKIDTARANAPNTVRTFGRIVSLQDFEDAAREFAGIEKAHATVATTPLGEEEVRLTVAGFSKQVPDQSTRELLRADLDSRRDRNQRLLVQAGLPVKITIKVGVHSAANRIPADVQAAVRAALSDQFSWDKVDFGQIIHESGVYRVVQAVPGVVAAHIEMLDTVASHGLQTSIVIGDTQLPELNDGDLYVVDWQPETA